MSYSETRVRSIDAPPAVVFDIIADGEQLPKWAPGFAPAVRPDGETWAIVDESSPSEQRRIRIVPFAETGTVDIVATSNQSVGVFLRVLPNGGSSELLFTMFFPPDAEEDVVNAQLAVVDGELAEIEKLATGRHDDR